MEPYLSSNMILFTAATELWSERQNTSQVSLLVSSWTEIHHQSTIVALNNGYSVCVHQINDQRKAYKASLIKLLDDTRTRVRQAQQELSHSQHATRKYYDDKRSKAGWSQIKYLFKFNGKPSWAIITNPLFFRQPSISTQLIKVL